MLGAMLVFDQSQLSKQGCDFTVIWAAKTQSLGANQVSSSDIVLAIQAPYEATWVTATDLSSAFRLRPSRELKKCSRVSELWCHQE